MIKVLVTNDDGIKSPGLKALVKGLANLADVYVVAPDSEHSGMSHAITLKEPMNATRVKFDDAKVAYKITGKPADCVKFGVQKFALEGVKFDYVFSGINVGANLGRDVHYSGTVSAAFEGALQGIRSIALSMGDVDSSRFGVLTRILPDIIKVSRSLDSTLVLNVNAPDIPASKIKGVKFIDGRYNSFNDVINQQDDGTYKYVGHLEAIDDEASDIYCVHDGYITMAPLSVDWVDKAALAKLNGLTGVKPICLFIDYQDKLVPAMRKSKDLMENVVKFAKCVDRLDLPVVVSQQYSRGLGTTVSEVKKALPKYENVDKVSFSCFGAPGFEEMFQTAVSRNVIICGIESHICVLQTVLDFLDRGFNVTVIKDCCGSRRKEDHETAMALMASKGAAIMTWESFVYMQMGASTHSAFRTITEIVKE